MRYVLDTNAAIALIGGDRALLDRFRRHGPEDYVLPSIVLHELYYGAFKSRRVTSNIEQIQSMRFAIIDFDRDDARVAGQLRAELAAKGMPIGPYDALIAAQALQRSLTVVTRNRKEFERVLGLTVESW